MITAAVVSIVFKVLKLSVVLGYIVAGVLMPAEPPRSQNPVLP